MADKQAALPGADVLLQCLIHHGVDVVFAYPGGATLPIHQALTRVRAQVRTILPRHEQGGGFAAAGYARATGRVGVCFATSGPGATNLVTCLADAQRAAVPLLAITGQVNHAVIGTDAFQEIPIVSVCRTITKHHYLVSRVTDIPRIVKEALHIAVTGRPGPVLIDVPKDIQARLVVADYGVPLQLPAYRPEGSPPHPSALVAEESGDVGSPRAGEDALRPEHVLAQLWRLLRERGELDHTILTTGVGPQQEWLTRAYRLPGPRSLLTSTSLGAVGFALSTALGAQAAYPSKKIIAIDTAASLLENVQEFACAHCEKLPVKVLLLNLPGADSGAIDFLALARGFGVAGGALAFHGATTEALEEMLDSTGPYLLDVHLRPSEAEVPAPERAGV